MAPVQSVVSIPAPASRKLDGIVLSGYVVDIIGPLALRFPFHDWHASVMLELKHFEKI